MSVDHIRYDLLVREALRGVVRRVVADVAKNGLPGDHHLYIAFETRAPGVRISPRLSAQYPEEMTIVLQHQFWDLTVSDVGIEVGLSFGGVPEKLFVPFEAIKGFFDPSVQFGLEFEVALEKTDDAQDGAPATGPQPVPALDTQPAASARSRRNASEKASLGEGDERPAAKKGSVPPVIKADEPPPTEGGAEVVRLDRFRKK